jgi:ribonuclease P protein component
MSRSARKEGLSRRHRFSERGSFVPALHGPRKLRSRLVILHAVDVRGSHSRLGIALTRRLVPSAVHRNQVKRLVREAFRAHPLKACGLDCVVSLRERYQPESREQLRGAVVALFDQLASSHRR